MINVYLRPMPGYCHEMVRQNPDGSYTIVVNSDLCREQQMDAYLHALRHINNRDFEDREMKNVQELERNAHGKVIR